MSDKAKELADLEAKLKELKARRPEHCTGTDGFVGVHKASPELWAEIEEFEERIEKLKAEAKDSASG